MGYSNYFLPDPQPYLWRTQLNLWSRVMSQVHVLTKSHKPSRYVQGEQSKSVLLHKKKLRNPYMLRVISLRTLYYPRRLLGYYTCKASCCMTERHIFLPPSVEVSSQVSCGHGFPYYPPSILPPPRFPPTLTLLKDS